MKCQVHDLKWVAVWIEDHCFMLRRCVSCRRFAVGFTYTKKEPFRNSTNISIDQVPPDKLREMRTFVSRIPAKKQEPESVCTFTYKAE